VDVARAIRMERLGMYTGLSCRNVKENQHTRKT